ncbi:MAG: mechanosensitive ion channel family protein, partial [Bacteroidetes bacterium]
HPWLVASMVLIITWLGLRLCVTLARWWLKRRDHPFYLSIVNRLSAPLSGLLPMIIANLLNGELTYVASEQQADVGVLLTTFAYAFGGWTVIGLTDVLADTMRRQYHIDSTDNLRERKIITQLEYIRKVIIIVVIIITLAFILLQFEQVRQVGTSLLASAGVAGILIGVAAQKSIANLLAGFQIAFTQPIRIDDVVVLEGEFGWVEEITLTYVVVRLWDQRRLVLPLQYFIEKPFQNWTRRNSEILGTVFLYVDYTLPLQALREELERYLPTQPLWDGRVANVVLFETHPQSMQVRVLVSGRNASETFDLRCAVREHLVTFIQKNYPTSLVRMRVEMDNRND